MREDYELAGREADEELTKTRSLLTGGEDKPDLAGHEEDQAWTLYIERILPQYVGTVKTDQDSQDSCFSE